MEHCKIKENANVSLHDSRTNRIKYEKDYITFYFPNGFYYIEDDKVSEEYNGEMKCRLSGKFSDNVSVYVYKKNRLGKFVRMDYSDKFISDINKGKYEYEFVTTYRGYMSILIKGYIWFDKAPYCTECEIEIHTDEITYTYNG